jgi:type I restriction enzyme, S subunit
MRTLQLGEVLRIDRTPASKAESQTLAYVGLEHIEKESGNFAPDFRRKSETLLATKFHFTPQHVLYGKLRPYLNKVLLPDFEGVCTTEILPLLPKSNVLERRYLYYILLSSAFVKWASRNVSGANLPRLDPQRLREYEIALPSVPEQQRIAGQLEKADRLRRTRRYALELGDTFLQSVFLKMFGDPATNSKGWDFESFEEFLEGIDAGVNFKPVAENDAASPWRVLKISAVTSGEFNARESKSISADVAPSNKLIVRKGDFLMSRANTAELVGAVCRVRNLPPKVLLPDKLWRVKFVEKSKLDPEYALILLQTREMRRRMGLVATGTSGSMKNITQEDAAALLLPIPPLPLQQEFAGIVCRFERLRVQQREANRQAKHLFQTLLHTAFASHE